MMPYMSSTRSRTKTISRKVKNVENKTKAKYGQVDTEQLKNTPIEKNTTKKRRLGRRSKKRVNENNFLVSEYDSYDKDALNTKVKTQINSLYDDINKNNDENKKM
ncbi:hypothetical protein EDEG_02133 [Edhazardia aedis USNM 41457]|uniref:Uncharacterized protein n=1 Tax=Edhazardia aedis (strain USNM 41457) TaxID=1003232 RepID=J9D7T7_EDHAE|nr:hypothetical protein EDEG_02133 [Edhazardia aedis USNM 41457]|eukprot:EJW03549.1 hypothetical protein EDEG_02133 [Edhazardia aedis USNM 41457]